MFSRTAADEVVLDPAMSEQELDNAEKELDVKQVGRSGAYWPRIRAKILETSSSTDIDEAVKEWKHMRTWMAKNGVCELCGHHPIVYHFLIENRVNNKTLVVGSECIYNYLEVPGVPDPATLKKRLNQLRNKLKAVADGKASEDDLKQLEALQLVERETNIYIDKLGPDAKFDTLALLEELSMPFRNASAMKITTSAFQAISQAYQALTQLGAFLEDVQKRSKKCDAKDLKTVVVAVMNFRSGGTKKQIEMLEAFQKKMAAVFNYGKPKDFVQTLGNEIVVSQKATFEAKEKGIREEFQTIVEQYNQLIDVVKPYPKLEDRVRSSFALIENSLASKIEYAKAHIIIPIALRYYLWGGTTQLDIPRDFLNLKTWAVDDANENCEKLATGIRSQYDLREIRDTVGVRKAYFWALSQQGFSPTPYWPQAITHLSGFKEVIEEEVDDIKDLVKATGNQKVFEAMSEIWKFDSKKFFQMCPKGHPFLDSFARSLEVQFMRGRTELSFKQQAVVDRTMRGHDEPKDNMWEALQPQLTAKYTPTYAR